MLVATDFSDANNDWQSPPVGLGPLGRQRKDPHERPRPRKPNERPAELRLGQSRLQVPTTPKEQGRCRLLEYEFEIRAFSRPYRVDTDAVHKSLVPILTTRDAIGAM